MEQRRAERRGSGDQRRGSLTNRPFYEAVDQEEIRQGIHARVVKDTRRAVRSLVTTRPVTPQDRNRGLFGVSTTTPSNVKPPPGRPTSAFPMGRKQFLQNLQGITTADDTERPASVLASGRPPRLAPLMTSEKKLRTSRTLSEADGEDLSTSPSTSSSSSSSSSSAATGKRPLPRPPRRASIDARIPTRTHTPPQTPGSGPANISMTTSIPTPTTPTTPTTTTPPPTQSAATTPTPRPPNSNSSSSIPRSPRVSSRSSSAAMMRVSTAQHQDSGIWQEISGLIAKLDPDPNTIDELCSKCDRLHDILVAHPVRSSRRKGAVLRGLYRLLDLRDCRLLIKVVKLIFLVRPANDVPTLTNGCKLIFKLTRDERNDQVIRNEGISPILANVLASNKWRTSAEALLWCCGAMKNLTSTGPGRQEFVDAGAIQYLVKLIQDIVEDDEPTPTDSQVHETPLVEQMMAVLRNLADSSTRALFLESNVIEHMCSLLQPFGNDSVFMLNCSRVLSKLTLQDSCRNVLAAVPDIFRVLLDLVAIHRTDLPVALRLLFTLGNITDSEIIVDLRYTSAQLTILFDLLTGYMQLDSSKEAVDVTDDRTTPNEETKTKTKTTTAPIVGDVEDVLSKLIRVIANLCINPDIGPTLAEHAGVESLISLLGSKDVLKSPTLVLCLVGTLNNLSFYRSENNRILMRQLDVAELLVPLLKNEMLKNDSMDVVIETARVFGNFSQDKSVRDLLRDTRADELMIILLDHDNREVVYTVCGVLINMMGDDQGRKVLQSAGGIKSLIDVLVQIGQTDWQLAGMVCKTFWNFCEGCDEGGSYVDLLGEHEYDELSRILNVYLGLGDELESQAEDYSTWEAEFSTVAQHLSDRLCSKTQ